jgi:DNA repair exonuclease SbcCD ATPase subunit
MIQKYRDRLNQIIGRRDVMRGQLEADKAKQATLQKYSTAVELTQALIQKVAQETQNQLRYHIEDIVNVALGTCFLDEYDFQVLFEIKRGRTEASLVLYKNGFEIDPMNSSGGGLVDILSLGLRIAAWTLGDTRNTLILDEGLKFLSRDLQPRAATILKELSEKLGIQILMVSHSESLIDCADKRYEVKLLNGVSIVS